MTPSLELHLAISVTNKPFFNAFINGHEHLVDLRRRGSFLLKPEIGVKLHSRSFFGEAMSES